MQIPVPIPGIPDNLVLTVILIPEMDPDDDLGWEWESSTASGEIVVDEGGDGDYTDLSSDVLEAGEGDRIVIRAGNYTGDPLIGFHHDLDIRGLGRNSTKLIFGGNGGLFNLDGFNVSISGVNITSIGTLENAYISITGTHYSFSNSTITEMPNGVQIRSFSSNVTFCDNTLINSTFQVMPLQDPGDFTNTIENITINGLPFRTLINEHHRIVSGEDVGGYLVFNSTNITISDVMINMNLNGISVHSSSNITISNSEIHARSADIDLYYSWNITMNGNQLYGGEDSFYEASILGWRASGLTITGNSFHGGGLVLFEGENNTIDGNEFLSRDIYFFMDSSVFSNYHYPSILLSSNRKAVVTGNTMNAGGIMLNNLHDEQFVPVNLDSNLVAGRPIYFIHGARNVTVPGDAGQVIAVGSENVTIQGITIVNTTFGITLVNVINSTIQDVGVSGSGSVIGLQESSGNLIKNLHRVDPGPLYLELEGSDNNVVQDSIFGGNLWSGMQISFSNRNRIENNTFISNGRAGLELDAGSSYNIITGNTFENNSIGVDLESSGSGNMVNFNNFTGNSEFGLVAWNRVDEEVDAANNWWGDASGPYHPQDNPDGKGENFTGDAAVSPWLEEVYQGTIISGESSDSEPNHLALSGFISILVILLLLLGWMVMRQEQQKQGGQDPDGGNDDGPDIDPAQADDCEELSQWAPPDRSGIHGNGKPCGNGNGPVEGIRCGSCGKIYDIPKDEQPLKPVCHGCGNELV